MQKQQRLSCDFKYGWMNEQMAFQLYIVDVMKTIPSDAQLGQK